MKHLAYFLLLVSILSLSAMEVVYYDELSEGGSDGIFEWAIAPDGNAVITRVLNQSATSLTIPAQLGGRDVKYIGYAYRYDDEDELGLEFDFPWDGGYWDEETDEWVESPMKTIAVESGSKYFSVSNNTLFNKDKTVLYFVPPASGVTSYSVPSGVKAIYHQAFGSLAKLKSVTIPSGVTEIGEGAFHDCEALATVNLPNTLKIIYGSVFDDCESLISIILPESLEVIGDEAFEGTSLTSIIIPKNVRQIGDEAFDCQKLKEIIVASGNKYFSTKDGVLFNYDKTRLVQYPCGKSGSSYSIPSGVKIIGDSAFDDANLTQVTIPNTVITIEEFAFADAKLTSLTIPASVTYIGEGAFWGCEGLTRSNVKFLGEIPEGAEYAFDFQLIDPFENFEFEPDEYGYDYVITRYIGKGTAVTVPRYVQEGDSYGNRKQVVGIASGAFAGCAKVKSIALPPYLRFIEPDAFEGCVALEKFTMSSLPRWGGFWAEDGILYYKYEDYYYGGDDDDDNSEEYYSERELLRYPPARAGKGFIIPADVNYIHGFAFDDCANLTTVYTDNYDLGEMIADCWPNLTVRPVAEAYPFNYSIQDGEAAITGLNRESTEFSPNLVIPASIQGCPVTNIWDYAFADAEIESIVLPDTVTSIWEGAFYHCPNLREITIPASVTHIDAWAFGNCASLAKFSVASGSDAFQVKDGVLYSADGTTLVAYPAGKAETTFAIPNTVKIIGPGAFDTCEKLTAITIPTSVTEIGYYAFYYCTGLKSLIFPDGLEYLPNGVCAGCASLTSVTIPDSVIEICDSAFSDCTSLTSVTIPDSVIEIGDAFADCTALTSVTIPVSVIEISGYAFDGCTALAKFQVAEGNTHFKVVDGVLYSADGTVLVSYPPAKAGKSFSVPSTVTEIAKHAFCSAANLTSVTIPDSVQTIGPEAFLDCASLAVFTIGDGVQYLDYASFFITTVLEYDEEYDEYYETYSSEKEATGTIYTDNEYVRAYLAENYPLVTVNYTGPVYDLQIALNPGWNAIMLPVTPDAASASALRSRKTYQLDAKQKCYVQTEQFRQGELYWFYSLANDQLNIHGVQKPNIPYALLSNGWAVYGTPKNEKRNDRQFMEFTQGIMKVVTDSWLSAGKGYFQQLPK